MSIDGWQEVLGVLSRNKLRAALTALSVAWGIFILILLVAAGNGLSHNVEYNFRQQATHSILIAGGSTAVPFAGHGSGRPIRFELNDLDAIRRDIAGAERLSGLYFVGAKLVSHGDQSSGFELNGCHPDYQYLERTLISEGRFINELDVKERRKVAVIGSEVKQVLFGTAPALEQMLSVLGVHYKVVGVFEDDGGDGADRQIYIPVTTAQLVYHASERLHQIMFSTGAATAAESEALEAQARTLFASRYHFDPADRRALLVFNNLAQFRKLMDVFDWLKSFLWVVSAGTLLAGIVGVSNIMIISVRERTLEIGIRKAMGATPLSIVGMVLCEALLLTCLAGYAGLSSGVVLVEAARRSLPENAYVRDPSVDVGVALIATALLTGAGALAGLLPALQAARVRPIVAMRDA